MSIVFGGFDNILQSLGLRSRGYYLMIEVDKAAIRILGGEIFFVERPGRHHDVIRIIRETGYNGSVSQQGFLLSDGRFVNRKDALLVAISAGQVEYSKCHSAGIGLFSEDIW